jgi:hypothetical protein
MDRIKEPSIRSFKAGETVFLRGALAAGIAAFTAGAAVPALGDVAQPPAAAITCVNPYSGVNWQIKIDFGRATVDSNPARIDDATITWFDPNDGGNYTLDRRSGELTVVVASSTGGYFLHDRCKLETPG